MNISGAYHWSVDNTLDDGGPTCTSLTLLFTPTLSPGLSHFSVRADCGISSQEISPSHWLAIRLSDGESRTAPKGR
jgi:hypothetical protein